MRLQKSCLSVPLRFTRLHILSMVPVPAFLWLLLHSSLAFIYVTGKVWLAIGLLSILTIYKRRPVNISIFLYHHRLQYLHKYFACSSHPRDIL